MQDAKQDTKQAATSAATNTSTPGAVHVDVSSMKGQQAFQKTKVSTGGPTYYLEDAEQLTSGLEQESVSSKRAAVGLESQKATNVLTDGPTYYFEDDKKLQSGLEEESVSSKRASGQSHNDKVLKQLGKPKKTNAVAIADEKLKKESPATRAPPSVSPTQQGEQDNADEDEEDVAPGAIRVAGTNSTGRAGDEEDGLTSIMPEEDVTIVGVTDREYETNAAHSTRMILEAQLVVEEDTELLDQEEQEQIEEELRQKFHEELGQVAQAEVVGGIGQVAQGDHVVEDGGTKTRRRVLLCIGIIVILLGIILGTVLGTRDTGTNTKTLFFS